MANGWNKPNELYSVYQTEAQDNYIPSSVGWNLSGDISKWSSQKHNQTEILQVRNFFLEGSPMERILKQHAGKQ